MKGAKDGGKARATRGRNYDALEDEVLSRAWVHVSGDSVIGINQTAERVWTRVKESMEDDAKIASKIQSGEYDARPWTSIQARFAQIAQSIGKFMKCIQKTKATARESGANEMDVCISALQLYQTNNNKPFEHAAAYRVLAKCPKFALHLEQSSTSSPPKAGDKRQQRPPPDTSSSKKPLGVKAAKRLKQQERLQERERASKAESKREFAMLTDERNGLLLNYVAATVFSAVAKDLRHERVLEKQRALLEHAMEVQYKKMLATTQQHTDSKVTDLRKHRGSGHTDVDGVEQDNCSDSTGLKMSSFSLCCGSDEE